jgi:hypothetical protein
MPDMTPRLRTALCAALIAAGLALPASRPTAQPASAMVYGDAFWRHWSDGRGELSAYDLVFPRYGAPRRGTAVAIFVTEPFSQSARVKADPGKHPASDVFQVLKLNLVRDFATGIYDYNVMTSAFVALEPHAGRAQGGATKVSFSSQEWCGHVYAQALFDRDAVRLTSHSYFDGEADQSVRLPAGDDVLAEDALPIWARGLAAPALAPGGRRDVRLVRSLLVARLRHVPVAVESARLERSARATTITVPAGTFDVETFTAAIAGGRTWTFYVEQAAPRRLVRWTTSDGEDARLLGSDRLAYWQLNGPGGESALAKLGLSPRAPRTP